MPAVLDNRGGVQAGLHLLGDSSASHGTLQRLGSGRVKHLQTRQLWLQEKVYSGEVTVEKIPRERNWADLLTHSWTPASEHLFAPMGIVSVDKGSGIDDGSAPEPQSRAMFPHSPPYQDHSYAP